jgi:xylulokinase
MRAKSAHRAVLEGVAFALRQITDTMIGCGADLARLVASGNGLANPVWRQIVADVLARPMLQGPMSRPLKERE